MQGSLESALKKKTHCPIDSATLLVLLGDVAFSLGHMHSLELLHRDVAARNVLLNWEALRDRSQATVARRALSLRGSNPDSVASVGGASVGSLSKTTSSVQTRRLRARVCDFGLSALAHASYRPNLYPSTWAPETIAYQQVWN
jgi:serine/threonine protein kinase